MFQVNTVRKAAEDLMEKSEEDNSHLQTQLIDLATKWEKVTNLSVNKQQRLDTALEDVCCLLIILNTLGLSILC